MVPLQVPKHAPASREQWKEWNQVWPISWRKPELTAVTAATAAAQAVTVSEQHLMRVWMDRAYALAEANASFGHVCNAAVIVDPLHGETCHHHLQQTIPCHTPNLAPAPFQDVTPNFTPAHPISPHRDTQPHSIAPCPTTTLHPPHLSALHRTAPQPRTAPLHSTPPTPPHSASMRLACR